MVVLDTCAIIDLCCEQPTLAAVTQKDIAKHGAYILSISFAEIACKIKSKKLDIGITAEALYQQIAAVGNIEIVSVGVAEWFDAIELDWLENNDPADRVLVAFAARKKLPIVSSDKKIAKFYKRTIKI